MKKTLLKILAIVAFFIAQYQIRKYYGIDPRIWFFVVYGISLVGVSVMFDSEIKNMREYYMTHSFFDFVKEICERIKPIIEKIVNSFIYCLLYGISLIVGFTGYMYDFFFHDDFIARTTLYIIFLVTMAWMSLSYLIDATVDEGKKRTYKLIAGCVWAFAFLSSLRDFL